MSPLHRRVIAIACLCVLAGCDNFHQSVAMGPWQPVDGDEPAAADEREETPIVLTEVAKGTGPRVEVGDLVRLRYLRTTIDADKTPRSATRPQEAWVWTGREPDPNQDMAGNFGSPELRIALIGQRVGDQLELRVEKRYAEIKVPRYAIAGPRSPRTGYNEFIGQYDALLAMQVAGGEFAWSQQAWSRIEIVAACPARFFTRTARMEQWGYVPGLIGTAYDTERHGVLRWSAIEGQCPPPGGKVRFMLGPIYWRAEPRVSHGLMAWQMAYEQEHSRARHPEDYAFVTIDGRTLPPTGQ
ncbi:MAG: hypothetical protein U1F10_09235 [Burkholderiales bacterium]